MLAKFFWRKIKALAIVSCGTYATYCAVSFYTSEPKFYKNVIMPLVHKLDPETSHLLAVQVLKKQLISTPGFVDPPLLKSTLWDLEFDNPIGLAAGFDKHGEAVKGLHKIGFGFVEVGSVTPKPQLGNPKPRLFRLIQDNAVINRYGFNSDGHEVVFDRLQQIFRDDMTKRGIIGVNLGKNKDTTDSIEDYVEGVKKFAPIADYLVINVSRPNTKGLRILQRRKELAAVIDKLSVVWTVLVGRVRLDQYARISMPGRPETQARYGGVETTGLVIDARNKLRMKHRTPILVKIAPDLSKENKEDVASVLMRPGKHRVDGIIISNSTVDRPPSLQSPLQTEDGFLTGAPLKKVSTDAIKIMYALTRGEIPIIGVGGISSGADAYEKIRAGASLVQVYTALVYQGFPVITRIKMELTDLLKKDGYRSVRDAVGADHWTIT
uniref:Dihydroorotate dehydrogenase (quinone), mitochondrial n=1 Tax=Strigamia maritima TaxID=126957 RepID=T1JEY4_STRMM